MTREEAIEILKSIGDKADHTNLNEEEHKAIEAYYMAIQALEQEPCDDCISRQAVEEITWEMPNYTDALNVLTEVRDKVRALPSVTPQQKVGKWIRVDKDKLKCSECKVIHFIAQYPQSANINFCPNCGAKMEVSKYE